MTQTRLSPAPDTSTPTDSRSAGLEPSMWTMPARASTDVDTGVGACVAEPTTASPSSATRATGRPDALMRESLAPCESPRQSCDRRGLRAALGRAGVAGAGYFPVTGFTFFSSPFFSGFDPLL